MAAVPVRVSVPLPVSPEGTTSDFKPLSESVRVRLMVTVPFVQLVDDTDGVIVGFVVSILSITTVLLWVFPALSVSVKI